MEGGPPRFPQGSSSPTVLRYLPHEASQHFAYGTFTPCGRPSQWRSAMLEVFDFAAPRKRDPDRPFNPRAATVHALARRGFRLFPVRSPLLGESRLFSFPPGTEMVQFPGYLLLHLCVQCRMTRRQTRRVTPFGHPRISGCVLLPAASRSLPRPSSYSSS